LVLASNNAKKLAELQSLLRPLDVELVAQGELGVPEISEPFHTFVENALAKARHAASAGNAAAIADDSGLCVDALRGEPGVASAVYATVTGHDADAREQRRAQQDAANNALLLERLRGVSDRRARFTCTLVALRSADDPEPLVAVGRWDGLILHAARGNGGFGYDPLMFIPGFDATVAELTPEVKNRHSHRALAAQQMIALMREVWRLGG
jgi:XTP/dITP diphosphohydrolase